MYRKLILALLMVSLPAVAQATKPPPKPKPPTQEQHQGQHQGQFTKNDNDSSSAASARSAADASSSSASNADSSSNNALHNDIAIGGPEVATTLQQGDTSNEFTSESNFESSPVLTLVPQGHTASCLRTIGLAWGDNNATGGLGWPFRDKDCDYDNEAADAFAAGQMKIGWFWNCHKKSSYKVFKRRGVSVEAARERCFEKMVSMLVVVSPPYHPSEPPVEVNVDACCKDRNKCGSDHPEIHKRIFEQCQSK